MKGKRIEWIDVSKGITIILMMIGHYVPYGSQVRNFIFAFHMPLFFILSGYTFKFLNIKKEMLEKNKIEIIRFLFPAFLLTIVGQLTIKLLWNWQNLSWRDSFLLALKRITWGNGVDYDWKGVHFYALGMPWFLITLIAAKLICNYLGKDKLNLALILTLFGVFIGSQIQIIWNLDLILVALTYIYTGYILKEKRDIYEKYKNYFLIISIIFFSCMLSKGKYIEMAIRSYPYGILSVLESVTGSIIAIEFSKYICLTSKIKKFLIKIGRISLIILLVHYFEFLTGVYIFFHMDKIIIKIIVNILVSYLISEIIDKSKFLSCLTDGKKRV